MTSALILWEIAQAYLSYLQNNNTYPKQNGEKTKSEIEVIKPISGNKAKNRRFSEAVEQNITTFTAFTNKKASREKLFVKKREKFSLERHKKRRKVKEKFRQRKVCWKFLFSGYALQ